MINFQNNFFCIFKGNKKIGVVTANIIFCDEEPKEKKNILIILF